MSGPIHYSETRRFTIDQLTDLYRANRWSAADKPELLQAGLCNSDSLVTAWTDDRLVGLGNALSDGHLVVYFPHLLVHPEFQSRGVGSEILRRLLGRYEGFHQQIVVSDARAVEFYRRHGFRQAGETRALWIYAGDEH